VGPGLLGFRDTLPRDTLMGVGVGYPKSHWLVKYTRGVGWGGWGGGRGGGGGTTSFIYSHTLLPTIYLLHDAPQGY